MADSPDVRVKLSAEGVAEVVAAFNQVAAAGKKSAKDTGDSFKELSKTFKEVGAALVGGLGVVLVAEKFREFFKTTLEGVEAMDRLSKQTGISTDSIQGLTRAAREVGLSQDVVNAGLAKFTASLGKAQAGSKQSASALSDLGISIKSIAGQTGDQKLVLIAQKLASIQDPARRARDEMLLFSRGGVELDQALVAVGKEGLDPFIERLKALGVFIDNDTKESLKRAQESFRAMGDEVKGVSLQFIEGLAPGLSKAVDQLASFTNNGVSIFKSFGAGVGDFIQQLVGVIENATTLISAFLAEAQIRFTSYASASANVLKGNFKQAVKDVRDASDQIAAIEDERVRKLAQNNLNALSKSSDGPKGLSGANGAGNAGAPPAGELAAVAKAKLALTQAYLDAELNLYKAHATLLSDQDKAAYEQGQLSLQDYYEKRAAIIAGELDKQIATAKAKRAAEARLPVDLNDEAGQINQRAQLVKLDGEIATLQVQRTAELAKNTNEQIAAQQKLYADSLKSEEALLTIEGRRADAARVKLAADLQALDLELRKGGVSDSDRTDAESKYVTQGNASIDFTDQAAKAQAALSSLESARKGIQDQVTSGEAFSIDAAQRILDLDRQRLPALQAQADALVKIAQTTGNAEDVAKAEAYKAKVDEITASTKILAQQTAELRQGIENAVGNGINKFFTDAEKGAKNFGQAFHDMGTSIENDLLSIANKILQQAVLQAIFGGNTPGSVGSSSPASALLGLGGALGGHGGVSGGSAATGLLGGLAGVFRNLFGNSAGAIPLQGVLSDADVAASLDTSGLSDTFSSIADSLPAVALASGGQIRGPGTSKSDSIPIWASDKEFIVNAEATQRPGMLPLLEAINAGNAKRRFADGGPVGTISTPQPVSSDYPRNQPGQQVVQHFHIQAPHGSISRSTQKQIAAEASRGLARAHQANN